MGRTRILRNDQGISLVEVLIAAGIIGVGLAGLMTVVPVASFGMQEGNQLSTATLLAQQRIEQVRQAAWTASPAKDCLGLSASPTAPPQAASGVDCDGAVATTFPDEASITGYPDYTRTTRIRDCGVGSGCTGVVNAAMRLVTVSVTYRPMTATGVSATGTTVSIDWVVAQR